MISPWDCLYAAALPAYAPVIAYKRARHGKYRESLPAMLGKRLPEIPAEPGVFRCWLHSVSVGETVAAGALYHELRRRNIRWKYLSTTTTETGQQQALKSLATAEAHAYAPADFSWIVRRFLDAYKPSMLVLLETELWPNLLTECGRRGIPVFLANGKLSAGSAIRYRQLAPFLRPALGSIRLFLMQTDTFAERMAGVLGSDEGIHVTGNVKFDALPPTLSHKERADLRRSWAVEDHEVVLIAGSTHEGEEILVCEVYKELRGRGLPVRLVIAPRHPERFGDVAAILRDEFDSVHSLSTGPVADRASRPVLLLDRMRELGRAYGGADIALLGGSWVNIGGHNLLEAAVHGIPVLHGPHMQNQPEILRLLADAGGCLGTTEHNLAGVVGDLVASRERRDEIGARGAHAAEHNRGASARSVELIEGWLRGAGMIS